MRQSPILGVAAALAGCALLVALAGGSGRTQAARAAQDRPAPAATVPATPASGAIASMRYNHGWMQTAGDVEQPDKIAVSTDRAAIAEGQTAHIHIAAPFAGHATVLVANDRILASHELAVPKGGVDVPVTAGADWGAGA
jgi:hypothetical protein